MEIPPTEQPIHTSTVPTLKKEKTLSSIMTTQKVRSTRSSRLREEQHAAAQQKLMGQRTLPLPIALKQQAATIATSNNSSASSTPHTTGSREVYPTIIPPLALTNGVTAPTGGSGTKSKIPHYHTLKNPIPSVPVQPPATAASSSSNTPTITPTRTTKPPPPASLITPPPAQPVSFSDFDQSSSITSVHRPPTQPQPVTPSTSSATSILSTSTPSGASVFSMPPSSASSPRLNSNTSMSILHLNSTRTTPSPSVSSTVSSKHSIRTSDRRGSTHPSSSTVRGSSATTGKSATKHALLSTAQRSVLEDINIITDWLRTVQGSEPKNLLQFRSIISRMKQTIFTPVQVRRARAQQQQARHSGGIPSSSNTAASSSTTRKSLPTTSTQIPRSIPLSATNLPLALQQKLARLSATPLMVHLDHSAAFDPNAAAHLDGDEGDILPAPASLPLGSGDYSADDSDYDELDGELGGGSSDFESKLSSFIKRTQKRDEDVLKSGGMSSGGGGYPHAPGVAFENGRWVPKPEGGGAASSLHLSASSSSLQRLRSHSSQDERRYNSSRSGHRTGRDTSDNDLDDLDQIPDFSQSHACDDHSSSSPSSVSQKHPNHSHLTFNQNTSVNGRLRSSSNSQSQSYNATSKRLNGASSVSLVGGPSGSGVGSGYSTGGAISPGFQDDSEVSMSMRSDSPSRAISMSQSQSVFSREMMFETEVEPEAEVEPEEDPYDFDDPDEDDMGEEHSTSTTTLLPQARTPLTPSRPLSRARMGGGIMKTTLTPTNTNTIVVSAIPTNTTKVDAPPIAGGADDFDQLDAIPDFDDAPPPVAVVKAAPAPVTGKPALAPFPFAFGPNPPVSTTTAAPQPTTTAAATTVPSTASNTSAPAPTKAFSTPSTVTATSSGGPTLITMQGWTAMGRPTSLDASIVNDALQTNAAAAAAVSLTRLPSVPSVPATEATLFVKSSQKNEFPDEIEFDDEDEEPSLPTNVPAKTVVKSPNPATTHQAKATKIASKMQTFSTMPASMMKTITANGPASGMKTITPAMLQVTKPAHIYTASTSLEDEDGLDEFDQVESSTNSNSGMVFSPSSEPDSAKLSRAFSKTKNFSQRTLVKKKGGDDDEFPSDLDDLSDADFSDEDRSDQTLLTPAQLGPAARVLNEFELTPALQSQFVESQQTHSQLFDGGLVTVANNPNVNHRLQTLLSIDSMTAALRNEYVAQKFNIDLILAVTQATANGKNALTNPTKHKQKSASDAHVSITHSHGHSSSVQLPKSMMKPAATKLVPPTAPNHQRVRSQPHNGAGSKKK